MIIGAYAATAGKPGDAEFGALISGLAQDPRVTGLEIPSTHLLSSEVADQISTLAPGHWKLAVTCFPATMLDMLADPHAGLASADAAGREKAMQGLARIHEAVVKINDGKGLQISDLFLHSAPRQGSGSALLDSLEELTSWDWRGCHLNLEHCDALVALHPPEKGFLSLDDELDAISHCAGRVGVCINWARSAIETRSAQGPNQHLDRAKNSGDLCWLMLSGVASRDTDFGAAWADAHLPFETVEAGSLLTQDRVRQALQHTTPDTELGLKIGLRPSSLTTAERLAQIWTCLDLVDRARSEEQAEDATG